MIQPWHTSAARISQAGQRQQGWESRGWASSWASMLVAGSPQPGGSRQCPHCPDSERDHTVSSSFSSHLSASMLAESPLPLVAACSHLLTTTLGGLECSLTLTWCSKGPQVHIDCRSAPDTQPLQSIFLGFPYLQPLPCTPMLVALAQSVPLHPSPPPAAMSPIIVP